VTRAHERLRGKVRCAPIGFELLPPRFSLTQLQRLYEIVLGTDLAAQDAEAARTLAATNKSIRCVPAIRWRAAR
jgi:hypothetical protein